MPEPVYRRAQVEKFKRRKRTATINNRIPQFQFRGGASTLHEKMFGAPRVREVMLSGPSETGKTIATLSAIDRLARTNPKATGVIVRKVRADMAATVIAIFKQTFVEPAGDIRTFGGENVEFFEYPNGTRVWLAGMDRPGKVLSGALDFAYVNQAEELALEDWEYLSTRTTGRAGVIVPGVLCGDCNPGPPSHWILTRSKAQRDKPAPLLFLESRHEDNPRLYDDAGNLTDAGRETMRTLDALTGVRKQRLRFGKWVQAEGVVYEEYDAAVHQIDEMPRGWQSWRKFRSIDFGLVHPFVCQWWALDHDGRMYRYRVLYMTGRTVATHAKQILECSAGDGFIETTVCDHDAEDRATLAENGIENVAANKAVLQGIGKVQDRLKKQADGKPRIYFLKNALVETDQSLLEAHKPVDDVSEFEMYVWQNKTLKEQPVKEFDHGLDATRYAVMFADEGQAQSVILRNAR